MGSRRGNVDGAGTFTVSTGDPGLAAVTFDLHSGSAATTTPYVFPAFEFHGKARETNSLFAGDTKKVMMLPGSYDLGMFTTWNNATYILYRSTAISGDTTLSADVTSASTALLHYDLTGATGGQVMTAPGITLFRVDPALDMHWGPFTDLQNVHAAVGTYNGRAFGSLTDSANLVWDYDFSTTTAFDLTTPGATVTHTFGGTLTAGLATNATSYAAGANVVLTPHASDPAGDLLTSVYTETSPNGAYSTPSLTVKDPGGTVVYADTQSGLHATSFQLKGTAPTGAYTATLTWDVGPYQSAPLTASTAFQVQ